MPGPSHPSTRPWLVLRRVARVPGWVLGDAEMHWALRVRCVCRRCHRCSECRRVRLLSAPRALLGASARSPARPRPRWRSPHWWRVVCDERPGCGPAGALHTGGSWSVVSGQAAAPPALSTPRFMVCMRVTRSGPLRPAPSRCLIAALATNFACNSPVTTSKFEIAALELQRFQT